MTPEQTDKYIVHMSEYVRPRVNFTLSPEAIDLLEEIAQTLGTSRSAAVEEAVRWFWAERVAGLAKKLGRRKGKR